MNVGTPEPAHEELFAGCPVTTGIAFIEISVPLSEPVTDGLLDITLIRYPVPVEVPLGIVPLIVPAVFWTKVPSDTRDEKDPDASDN